MKELFAPFLTYAVLMTFTPGPNNVSASALGLRVGYRRSLPFLSGIASGFMLIMLAGGLLTDFLTRHWALISPWLKWTGVVYMVWLAVSLFVEKPKEKSGNLSPNEGYLGGFLLQFVNPKGILYGITIYTSFASLLTGDIGLTLASALFLTALAFASISLWSLVGSGLSRIFERRVFRLTFNGVMALLLLWSALSIILH